MSDNEFITNADEFYQFSQRCTICGTMLWAGDDIGTDPRNNNHMVHEDCRLSALAVTKSKKRKRVTEKAFHSFQEINTNFKDMEKSFKYMIRIFKEIEDSDDEEAFEKEYMDFNEEFLAFKNSFQEFENSFQEFKNIIENIGDVSTARLKSSKKVRKN